MFATAPPPSENRLWPIGVSHIAQGDWLRGGPLMQANQGPSWDSLEQPRRQPRGQMSLKGTALLLLAVSLRMETCLQQEGMKPGETSRNERWTESTPYLRFPSLTPGDPGTAWLLGNSSGSETYLAAF